MIQFLLQIEEGQVSSATLKCDLNSYMNKYLKPSEVLDTLQKKVELKSSLKEAKKLKDADRIDKISKKIAKLESKLHSRPLIKT